jgi:hypothetical protein
MPLPRSICDTDAVVVSSPTLSRMVAICRGQGAGSQNTACGAGASSYRVAALPSAAPRSAGW